MSESDESLFREVDEEVRQEQLKRLWDRYGTYIVALCAVMMALGFYMQSLTPEQIERMDFLPPEVRESFNKQLELQQRLKESQQ